MADDMSVEASEEGTSLPEVPTVPTTTAQAVPDGSQPRSEGTESAASRARPRATRPGRGRRRARPPQSRRPGPLPLARRPPSPGPPNPRPRRALGARISRPHRSPTCPRRVRPRRGAGAPGPVGQPPRSLTPTPTPRPTTPLRSWPRPQQTPRPSRSRRSATRPWRPRCGQAPSSRGRRWCAVGCVRSWGSSPWEPWPSPWRSRYAGAAGARQPERTRCRPHERTRSRPTDAVESAGYDYRHLDRDFGVALAHSTPSFRRSFTQSSDALKTTLTRYHATAHATVVSAGLVSATTSRAVALVLVDQTIANSTQKTPTTDRSQVEITLVNSGGSWLIDQVSLL